MLWLWNFFLEKRQFSYVFITTLVIAGAYALIQMPKENAPEIIIPNGFVTTVLPGASAADMETLVTNKLEDRISGISNIDTITSSSGAGISSINVQFVASADINQSIQDLRDAVAKAVPDLPADATTPSVMKINISDQPILVVSISGDLPAPAFSTLGKSISDDLKGIVGVSEVDVAGVPPREVTVVVSKEKLQQYDLRLSDVIGAIGASNAALPAGTISMEGVEYAVNFKGGITSPNQIQDIAVGAARGGAPIYLRDVALISDGLAAPTTYSRLSINGEPSRQAITLTIHKQSGASIVGTANAVRERLAELQNTKLAGMDVYISSATDAGKQVGHELGNLAETGLITVLLVIATLLVTIGWRESLVAALSIPMSFLIAFLALYVTGNSLNFISLFALILAVGILVDSGIVVTEAIHARMRTHGDPMKAAKAALQDYAWPLIAGTMATVAVFAPLFFLSGIIGEYIAGIPYTLVFVLIASILVALGMVPLLAILLTKPHAKSKLELLQEEYTERITQWYQRRLRQLLENHRAQRWFLRGLAVAFIAALILPFTGVLSVLFLPQDDQDFVFLNIEKPQGTTLAQTDLTTRAVEEILYEQEGIASFQTTVGGGSALLNGSGGSGSNLANITINLPEDHELTSTEWVTKLQKAFAPITDAKVQVLQASNGPPSGAPIQIRFEGENLEDLVKAADAGAQMLSTIPHVTNINSTTKNNGTAFDLTIDRAKAAAYGVTTAQIAQTLRAAVNGAKATSITQPDQDIDVVVKLNLNAAYTDPSQTNQTTLDSIRNLSIKGTSGNVLLGSLLTENVGPSNTTISHKDKLRVETVSAYTDGEITAAAAVSAFEKRVDELNLPDGVRIAHGGEQQEINRSFTQMFIALIAGLVLMFMILIISFNSFRYTGQLLIIVPLSLIGVLFGLAITAQPISFSSLLGVIALGGVIINHAIILMDSMIHHVYKNPSAPLLDTIVEASATRLRPIVLTTIATVVGMIPLSFSNATWGPLAFSIMFGLTFAIILTLALVPVLFYRAPHPELGLPKLWHRK